MDSTFTNELVKLGNTQLVVRAMMERRARILDAIADGTAQPSEELMKELFELNVGIGDAGIEMMQ